ncbi:MAG: F-box protein [Methylomonas sp.]|jgi:hypothetical protein|uniref:F-box protein n=1 Tax=Methylomonas sp. TaxID=418 RepID=UPI0025E2A943|nr:F-box protein [Methylomonas sp.]MCK9608529.1 F-box protein [Methylomonas sp.]
MDNFSSWQIIFEYLDARSLACCAQVCTMFRTIAKDLFKRKSKIAYDELIAFLVENHDKTENHLLYYGVHNIFDTLPSNDIIGHFGEWCPNRCAKLLIFAISQISPADGTINREFYFLENNIFHKIWKYRGIISMIAALNKILNSPQIMRYDAQRPNFTIASFCAKVLSFRITSQNALRILQFLDAMPCSKTADIFDYAIGHAIFLQNGLHPYTGVTIEAEVDILDKVLAFVSTSKTEKIKVAAGMPSLFDEPHPLFHIYNFLHNQQFIEKYEPQIPMEYRYRIPEFIIYNSGGVPELEALVSRRNCHFDDVNTLEFVLVDNQQDNYDIADWLVARITTTHGKCIAKKTIAHVLRHETFQYNMPEERICWIWRNASFDAAEKNLRCARYILRANIHPSVEFAEIAAAFAREHNLFLNEVFKNELTAHFANHPEILAIFNRAESADTSSPGGVEPKASSPSARPLRGS